MVKSLSAALQQKNIEKANKAKDPFQNITCESFASPNATYSFNFFARRKCDMDPKVLKWAFKLAEKNISPFYRQLEMGWQPKVKQTDLNKNWARYLVAEENKRPIAFAMFRFDMDYSYSVLYCYEMQVDEAYQRKGLGKYMMNALEKCAQSWSMEKIVLTVLNNNPNGISFFKSIGYVLDDSSPGILENVEYKILSKKIEL